MKKILLVLSLLFFGIGIQAQNVYNSKNININFFSSAPLEDIEAFTKNGSSILNIAKNEIIFLVQIKSFTFQKSLMQEHFNETYMESSKYPDAKFIGSINETIDWKKDGIYPVTVSGKLNIHGVEKDRTVAGTLSIKDGVISINSQFDISCSDHNIKIPSMMSEKIAEIVKVTISGTYSLYVKPVK